MLAIGLFLVSINYVHSLVLSPECNYAVESAHFYPIGACDKTKNVTNLTTTYSAFSYICQNGEVFKYEYNTDEYCEGQPLSSTNYTDQLEDFECNLGVCDHSDSCGYLNCFNSLNGSCAECERNKQNYGRHCTPFITDHCMDNVLNECVYGVLTETTYSGSNCSHSGILSSELTGGSDPQNNCYNDTYFEVDCVARSVPICNYAATDHHYYPIGACDTAKTTNATTANTQYFAFEYICANNGDVYRNEYDTNEYCKGTPVLSMRVNAELQHYDCGLSDCQFADSCALSLNSCDSGGCDYDTHCLPMIINNCIGLVGDLLHYATCNDATLNESFYFGVDCDFPLWTDSVIGDEDESQCGDELFHKVQCIDDGSPDSIIYHSTQCTQAPTPNPTQTPTPNPTQTPTQTPTITECDREDIGWAITIIFRFKFILNPMNATNKAIVQKTSRQAFIDTILFFLGELTWNNAFCVELSDDALKIEVYEAYTERRRLLQTETEYSIEAEFGYNNGLQDAFFDTGLYEKDEFGEKFGEETRDVLVTNNFINEDVNAEGIEVSDVVEFDDGESGHVVEGAVINTVSIISIIDVIIFVLCMIYVFRILKKRSDLEGNCLWTELFKQIGVMQYIVVSIEISVFIIDWIFVIDVIVVDKTYLGWIGLMLLIFAGIVLYFRYSLYKKLCVYQINDIVRSEKGKNEVIDYEEIRVRQVDIGIMGILLMSVEDIPIIIILIIIGDNWDYYALVVLGFIVSLVSIAMKVGLLFGAKCDDYENKRYERTHDVVQLAGTLAVDKADTTGADTGDGGGGGADKEADAGKTKTDQAAKGEFMD